MREGNRTIIQEPGRTIIREGDRTIIRQNEADRFRYNARDVNVQRRGRDTVTTVVRPDGTTIITTVDNDGRLLRRSRRERNGGEYVLIDNVPRGGDRRGPGGARIAAGVAAGIGIGAFVTLAAPRLAIPRERYIVEADGADEGVFYDTFIAPPVDTIERRYTLDEIRYSPSVRDRVRRVDVDTVNFESGSWEVTPDQAQRLAPVANAIRRAIERDPRAIFLIEGHTDATGSDDDNLSLSDRRAESVAVVLSEQFGVPAENLTSQGYGEQQLKVPTDGPERQNRRVTLRNITQLLAGQANAAPPPR